jgi:hypothetical protein
MERIAMNADEHRDKQSHTKAGQHSYRSYVRKAIQMYLAGL